MNPCFQFLFSPYLFILHAPSGWRINSELSFTHLSEEFLPNHPDSLQKFLSNNQGGVVMPSSALPQPHILCSLIVVPSLNHHYLCHCLPALLKYNYLVRPSPAYMMCSPLSELHKYSRTNILRTASGFFRPRFCQDSRNISQCWLLLSICSRKRSKSLDPRCDLRSMFWLPQGPYVLGVSAEVTHHG